MCTIAVVGTGLLSMQRQLLAAWAPPSSSSTRTVPQRTVVDACPIPAQQSLLLDAFLSPVSACNGQLAEAPPTSAWWASANSLHALPIAIPTAWCVSPGLQQHLALTAIKPVPWALLTAESRTRPAQAGSLLGYIPHWPAAGSLMFGTACKGLAAPGCSQPPAFPGVWLQLPGLAGADAFGDGSVCCC